ncbi:unnamed protein product, partial [Choristocarpus tenellus]
GLQGVQADIPFTVGGWGVSRNRNDTQKIRRFTLIRRESGGGSGGKRGSKGGGGSQGKDKGKGGGRGKRREYDEGELEKARGRFRAGPELVSPEFSRPEDISDLSRKSRHIVVEANDEERAALANRFNVEGIKRLRGSVKILRSNIYSRILIKGQIEAEVDQLCRATLRPLTSIIESDFETDMQVVSFDDLSSTLWAMEEGGEADDEIQEGDPLDVGEVVAQELALKIDPYAIHPDHVPSEIGISLVGDARKEFFGENFVISDDDPGWQDWSN